MEGCALCAVGLVGRVFQLKWDAYSCEMSLDIVFFCLALAAATALCMWQQA